MTCWRKPVPRATARATHPDLSGSRTLAGLKSTPLWVLNMLSLWPSLQASRTAGRDYVHKRIAKHNPRLADKFTSQIFVAIEAQMVIVRRTNAAATIVPMTVLQLADLHT